MSNYDNSNSGSLNPTKDKRTEKSPDWYGRLQISGEVLEALRAGKPIRVSGWNRSGQYGEFISLKASVEQPKAEKPADGYDMRAAEKSAPQREQQQPVAAGDYDDEIPF